MEKVRRVRKKERGIKKVLEVERLDRCHTCCMSSSRLLFFWEILYPRCQHSRLLVRLSLRHRTESGYSTEGTLLHLI